LLSTRKFAAKVLIREDDVNYFTRPDFLLKLHKPLMELSLPINLAIIPVSDCKLKEPFIDQNFRGRNLLYSINDNKDLIDFIKGNNFTIIQHGYTHTLRSGLSESRMSNPIEFMKRMCLGAEILKETFGTTAKFFTPPRDYLCRQAWPVILEMYHGVMLNTLSLTQTAWWSMERGILDFVPKPMPLNFMVPFLKSRVRGINYVLIENKVLVLEDKGLYVEPPFDLLLENVCRFLSKYRYVTVVSHYWSFTDNRMVKLWHKILDLLINSGVKFSSIEEVYREVRNYKY